jgi:ZIP family zinc transporter
MTSPLILLPVASTIAGGVLAAKAGRRLPAVMTVTAGILVATALADLAPEAAALAGANTTSLVSVLGFVVYLALEGWIESGSGHEHGEHDHPHEAGYPAAAAPVRRPARLRALAVPASLLIHSSLDGIGVGTALVIGGPTGLLVLAAVIGHDIADGLNVVTLARAGGATGRQTAALLIADAAVVPIAALIAGAVEVDRGVLGIMLALFAGVFVAIGAAHLLPEAKAGGMSARQAAAGVAAGALLVAGLRMLAG